MVSALLCEDGARIGISSDEDENDNSRSLLPINYKPPPWMKQSASTAPNFAQTTKAVPSTFPTSALSGQGNPRRQQKRPRGKRGGSKKEKKSKLRAIS